MHHVLITFLLAYFLFPLSFTSSHIQSIEERVSLWPEAIEQYPSRHLHLTFQALNNFAPTSQQRVLTQRTPLRDSDRYQQATFEDITSFNSSTTTSSHGCVRMATSSAKAKERSRIIREMNRDFIKPLHSPASSTGSCHGTVSPDSTMTTDFDPERDEALMSTVPIHSDFSQKLPELRDTAKKYRRWAPRPQENFVIDTSALGRAFPDFSQGSGSDLDLSISLEAPRGNSSQRATSNISNKKDSPLFNIGSNIRIQQQTPRVDQDAQASLLRDALRKARNERHENPSAANTDQKENIPPTRQKPTNASANNSATNSPYISHASRTISGERRTLAELHTRVADDSEGSFMNNDRPATVTLQSRNTRFPKASQSPNSSKRQQASESTPTSSSKKRQPQDAQTSNVKSTTPNPTQQSFIIPPMTASSDQGTRQIDSPVPAVTSQGKVQLQASNSRPVDGIDLPTQEVDIYETARRLGEERDMFLAQLSAAHKTIADLQKDNKLVRTKVGQLDAAHNKFSDLQKENNSIKAKVSQLETEISEMKSSYEAQLDKKDRIINEFIQEVEAIREEYTQTRRQEREARRREFESLTKRISQLEQDVQPAQNEYAVENTQSVQDDFTIEDVQNHTSQSSRSGRSRAASVQSFKLKASERNIKSNKDNYTLEDIEQHTIQSNRSGRPGAQSVQSLKSKVSEHSIKSNIKNTKGNYSTEDMENETMQSDRSGRPRVASVQPTKSKSKSKSSTHRHHSQVEDEDTIKSTNSHRRHHSDTTVHTKKGFLETDDMTSAYLIADIDAAKQSEGSEHPVLSANARRVLDELCRHNCKNCNICLRLASFDKKKSVHIEKPICVSQRMPETEPYEDEPTMRPSVAPGLALATVIKNIQDEIAHLKIKHAEVQRAYTQHDPTLGKRIRKGLKNKLDELMAQIESKSDQLYALFDVLEGQRLAKQEMSISQGQEEDDLDEEELPWEGIEETQ